MSALDLRLLELVGGERIAAARTLVDTHTPLDDTERWLLDYWRARLSSPTDDDPSWRVDVDSIHCRLRDLADHPDAPLEVAGRAVRVAAYVHIARRLRDLADRDLSEAEERFGATADAASARVVFHLTFDEREEARSVAEAALAQESTDELRLAYANLLYTVGDFEGALGQLREPFEARRQLDALDLEGSVHASLADLPNQLRVIDEAIRLSPDAERVAVRYLARAHVNAELDNLADARHDFEAALAAAPPEVLAAFGEYVRNRLDALDVATEHTPRARLAAFPSVVQRWNYCGPAVIELCLRFSGIEMTQDVIAAAVKEGEGTTPLAMVSFLREQGFEARRIEATPATIKRAIDLGFPVILQDNYTNTRHVTVAIGYDDRIGTLTVADPATHAPRPQAVELREEFGGSESFAGIVVMGREGTLTPELEEAASRAGLVESEHIALIDEIDRRDRSAISAFASATPLERAGLAEQALALKPDFTLASSIQLAGLLYAGAGYEPLFAQVLASERARHPGRSHLASHAAAWNEREGRSAMTIAESALAIKQDPRDADAHTRLGFALHHAGEWDQAFSLLTRAIAIAPDGPHQTAALAMLLRAELGRRAHAADPHALIPAANDEWESPRSSLARLGEADLVTLAAHVAESAAAMAPDDPNVMIALGDLAAFAGDFDAAVGHYEAAAGEAQGWPLPHLRLLAAHRERGDKGALRRVLVVAQAARWRDPSTRAQIIRALTGLGEFRAAADEARSGVDMGLDPGVLMPMWLASATKANRSEPEAAREIVEYARASRHRGEVMDAAIDVLANHSLTAQAVVLLEEALDKNPEDLNTRFTLAIMLARLPSNRDRAVALLREVLEAVPWVMAVRFQLAWLLVGSAPEEAYELATALPDDQLVYLELKRVAAVRVGQAGYASQLDSWIRRTYGSRFDADLAVGIDHLSARRYDALDALALAGAPDPKAVPDVVRWTHLMRSMGRSGKVAAFVEAHPELVESPEYAPAFAALGSAAGVTLRVRALEVAARAADDDSEARDYDVQRFVSQGMVAEAEASAGDDPHALATLAESHPVAAERARLARRARELAPHDRAVLAAYHAAMLDVGEADEAWAAARELAREFAFEHQGLERLAQCEMLLGDPKVGLELALQSWAIAPFCGQAATTAAAAHAVVGNWEEAGVLAQRSLSFGRSEWAPTCLEALVADAANGDRDGVEREAALLEAYAPGVYVRVIEAARAVIR